MTKGRVHRLVAGVAACTLVAACAPSTAPSPRQRAAIERALATAPGQANPSAVVATELAFARMAREEGQWTAFRQFAASGAVLHGGGGVVDAQSWLAGKDNPEAAVQWAPRELWASCDGGTVVSSGRFAEPAGTFGYFVTVWDRQSDGDYRYVYDFGWDDAELTKAEQARLARAGEAGADGILVEAYSMIRADVSDCPRGAAVPVHPGFPVASGSAAQSYSSRDGTLQWQWEHRTDGTRVFRSSWLSGGEWLDALTRVVPAASE